MASSTEARPEGGVNKPLVVVALTIVWAVVMGALGKGDPVMEAVGTQDMLLTTLVAIAFWICALCVLSFAAGARERLLPRGARSIILLVILGVVLGLEPGAALSRSGHQLVGMDVSTVVPGLALQAVGGFLTPFLTMLVIWMVTEALGDGAIDARSFLWLRAVGVSVLAGLLTFVLAQAVDIALGTTTQEIQAMLIDQLTSMEQLSDRLPLWKDMVLQLVSMVGLAPALLVPARRKGQGRAWTG